MVNSVILVKLAPTYFIVRKKVTSLRIIGLLATKPKIPVITQAAPNVAPKATRR